MSKEITTYLKDRYKTIKNIPDVNNNRYDAKPVFIKEKNNRLKSTIHTNDVAVGKKTIRIHRSSPMSVPKSYFVLWCYLTA